MLSTSPQQDNITLSQIIIKSHANLHTFPDTKQTDPTNTAPLNVSTHPQPKDSPQTHQQNALILPENSPYQSTSNTPNPTPYNYPQPASTYAKIHPQVHTCLTCTLNQLCNSHNKCVLHPIFPISYNNRCYITAKMGKNGLKP